jgi:hypothetical protein
MRSLIVVRLIQEICRMKAIRTPSLSLPHKVPNTVQQTRYFEHFDTKRDDESTAEAAAVHNIDERTGCLQRRQRSDLGDIVAYRRTNKVKGRALRNQNWKALPD